MPQARTLQTMLRRALLHALSTGDMQHDSSRGNAGAHASARAAGCSGPRACGANSSGGETRAGSCSRGNPRAEAGSRACGHSRTEAGRSADAGAETNAYAGNGDTAQARADGTGEACGPGDSEDGAAKTEADGTCEGATQARRSAEACGTSEAGSKACGSEGDS
jgi:hypothetical protein